MKSSTLHRSNLTKERMELLREIKAQRHTSNDNSPGIYVRPAKEKELDLLWQTFKVNHKSEKSINAYMVVGFIGGALAMFLLTVLISFVAHSFSENSMNFQAKENTKVKQVEKKVIAEKNKQENVNFLPPDNIQTVAAAQATGAVQQYTIQSGDTLDKIAMRFYGKYDSQKIDRIAQANGITNPHKISIGQVLTIPMD